MNISNEKAYVLLSGGQDSFVCLIWTLRHFTQVEAVSIAYNQRHEKEVDYAKKIAAHFNVPHHTYDIGNFLSSMSESTLLNTGNHSTHHAQSKNLPASFVPNRNGLFLTIIASHAFKQEHKHIHLVTGTCQTDFSGYPDCRDSYIKSKAVELSLGLDIPVSIYTPLMWKTKADAFAMADDAGKLNELIALTLTCYNGEETMHPWGYGCGECPSCLLRKKGYEEFLQSK